MRPTSPHQHCTTTGGAEDLNALGASSSDRGISAIVDFGGERRPIPEPYDAPGAEKAIGVACHHDAPRRKLSVTMR